MAENFEKDFFIQQVPNLSNNKQKKKDMWI